MLTLIESAYVKEEGRFHVQAVLRCRTSINPSSHDIKEFVVHTKVTEIVDSCIRTSYLDGNYTSDFDSALDYFQKRIKRLFRDCKSSEIVTETRMLTFHREK